MARPRFLQDFVPSKDYRLTEVLDAALRAEAILEARDEALADAAEASGQDPLRPYRPILLAQGWMDQVIRFRGGLRRLGSDLPLGSIVAPAEERYARLFPDLVGGVRCRDM